MLLLENRIANRTFISGFVSTGMYKISMLEIARDSSQKLERSPDIGCFKISGQHIGDCFHVNNESRYVQNCLQKTKQVQKQLAALTGAIPLGISISVKTSPLIQT